MDFETGIKYVGFVKYTKMINGYPYSGVRMINWEETLEESKKDIIATASRLNKSTDDYYIAKYDVTGNIMEKLGEYTI